MIDLHVGDFVRTNSGYIGQVFFMRLDGEITLNNTIDDNFRLIHYTDIKTIKENIKDLIEEKDILSLKLIENLYIVQSDDVGRLFIKSGDYTCYIDDIKHINYILTHELLEPIKHKLERSLR